MIMWQMIPGIGLTTQVTDRKKTEEVLLLGDGVISQTPKVVRSSMLVQKEAKKITDSIYS